VRPAPPRPARDGSLKVRVRGMSSELTMFVGAGAGGPGRVTCAHIIYRSSLAARSRDPLRGVLDTGGAGR
jgi:hypothetical protein